MKAGIRAWVLRRLVPARTVPINQCVHYCAFRYGCGDVNPYENYAIALARGEPLGEARSRFVDFLRHYRPRDFGQALGVELSQRHGLWQFPWAPEPARAVAGPRGWVDDPDDAPDIMTHFSERGILRFRIDEEFLWAEKLFTSIRNRGFQVRSSDRPIEACELRAADGTRRYLVVDGNHRLSALVALGEKRVTLRCWPLGSVRENAMATWPRVRNGGYTREDALRVFRAYFTGNRRPRTTETPAAVLETSGAAPR